MSLDDILGLAPVVPVLVVEDVARAVPLGRALVAGGLKALEVTLRTPAALEVIAAMSAIDGAVVGAGTILNRQDWRAAADAGARFAVSPGLFDGAGPDGPTPLLPGVATATELMDGLSRGLTRFKLFPANVAGGTMALKAFAGPFPQARFCPTGGIDAANAADYLALPNVACVGGSWVAPADAVRAGDWDRITRIARAAAELPRGR